MKDSVKKQSELASLQYVLKIIYTELHAHSGDCDHCDDVLMLFRTLQSLCKENGIRIHEIRNE